MYIEGKIKKVLVCPYKEGDMWCELELETLDHEFFTVMIPADVYRLTNHDFLREGLFVHITGQVIHSSHFVIAWHVSLKKGYTTNLIFEH